MTTEREPYCQIAIANETVKEFGMWCWYLCSNDQDLGTASMDEITRSRHDLVALHQQLLALRGGDDSTVIHTRGKRERQGYKYTPVMYKLYRTVYTKLASCTEQFTQNWVISMWYKLDIPPIDTQSVNIIYSARLFTLSCASAKLASGVYLPCSY